MKFILFKNVVVFVITFFIMTACCARRTKSPAKVVLSKETLRDKIKGGWAGQVIGCTYGGPTEFQYVGRMIPDSVEIPWHENSIAWYYDNFPGLFDDIYMDLTFVEVIEKEGVNAPAESFANAFANKGYQLWAANQMGRYNILNGIKPPASGHWINNPHADDIDFQIEADFIGLMYPGMPFSASKLADKVGHIMNYGDGWYGGVFVATMYSLAFTASDARSVVYSAIESIPEQSDFYKCITDIMKWHKLYPDDWRKTWAECQRVWGDKCGSPDGFQSPYNIDAKINSAYVVIGLLYGDDDFYKSIDIATRCGQDSDCNPATVAGILGTLHGYDYIPEEWKSPLTPILTRNFDFTEISLNDIYAIGYRHALAMIQIEGGQVKEDEVIIKTQPVPRVRYEKSFDGHYPVKLESLLGISLVDSYQYDFEGIGIVFRGNIDGPDDYSAQMAFYIDDQLVETAVLPANVIKRRYEMFYKYQLLDGKHRLSIKWLNPKADVKINLHSAITYSNKPIVD